MNTREGLRRLAIALGIIGAILGGVFGYNKTNSMWRAHTAHKRFEALVARPAVQGAARQAAADRASEIKQSQEIDLSAGMPKAKDKSANPWAVVSITPDPYVKFGGHEIVPPEKPGGGVIRVPLNQLTPVKKTCESRSSQGMYCQINDIAGGIDGALVDTATWTVSEISLLNGEVVRNDVNHPFYAYVGLLFYPAFGFLIPWLAVRGVAWVWAGFATQA